MRLLLRVFPRRFRDRYGDEVLALVGSSDSKLRDAGDLFVAAVRLRLADGPGRTAAALAYGVSLALIVSLGVGAVADDCTSMGAASAALGGLLFMRTGSLHA